MRLPYDRPHTTMRDFALCDACSAEYEDPGDRRFHAQPVACADCGPRIWFEGPDGVVKGSDAALTATQEALARGAIVAVKGLGGYHLACDATSTRRSTRLRRRKHRPDKPFAVMVPDLDAARGRGTHRPGEASHLTGPERPIVLLEKRPGAAISAAGGPGQSQGRRAPALHAAAPSPLSLGCRTCPPRLRGILVMTSGNLSDEPICYEDADARKRAWRPSPTPGCSTTARSTCPCDDSVIRVDAGDEAADPACPGLRAAPGPAALRGGSRRSPRVASSRTPSASPRADDALVSQHIGDMGSLETLDGVRASDPGSSRHVPDRPGAAWRPTRIRAITAATGPTTIRTARCASSSTITPTSPPSWSNTASRRASGSSGSPSTAPGTDRRDHLGRRGARRGLRLLRPVGAPAPGAAAGRGRRRPQAVPCRVGPPLGGRHRLGRRPPAGRGRPRQRARPCCTASSSVASQLRPHVEHGPPLRRRELAPRAAPRRHLRGPGRHGARVVRHGRPGRRTAVPLRRRAAGSSTPARCWPASSTICGRAIRSGPLPRGSTWRWPTSSPRWPSGSGPRPGSTGWR